ncbi:hypothetical protein ZWY2020_023889 [Hordeum vulgare]|nr:hypothetical protein ZWY2020_023889 [Hordeum vulgare]
MRGVGAARDLGSRARQARVNSTLRLLLKGARRKLEVVMSGSILPVFSSCCACITHSQRLSRSTSLILCQLQPIHPPGQADPVHFMIYELHPPKIS